MNISKETYDILLKVIETYDILLDTVENLEVIGTSEGGTTYYSRQYGFVIWDADGSYYFSTKEDFEGQLPED